MIRPMLNDLDYLAARVHGRRSRMAEGGRLDALARSRSFLEFARGVFAEPELATAIAFQRHSVQVLIREVSGLRAALAGAGGCFLEWLVVRFQVENLKVWLRTCVAKLPFDQCQEHLVELPGTLVLEGAALAKADSLKTFVRLLPHENPFQPTLARALAAESEPPRPFFYEAALDRAYLAELLSRATRLPGEDLAVITALAQQETDIFHLMLVARGRFFHGFKREELLPLHITGTQIPRARLASMLADTDLRTAMGRAVGRALDELPPERRPDEVAPTLDAAAIEALAWKRFARLANRAVRRGHVGLGAVVGYVGLRRVELANLITLSEGFRLGLAAEPLRARLIPRGEPEVTHV